MTELSLYAANTCPLLTPRQHVAIALTNENSYGSVAVYTCDAGSVMIGGHERTYRHCQASGLWTGQPAFCYGTYVHVCNVLATGLHKEWMLSHNVETTMIAVALCSTSYVTSSSEESN